MKTAMPIRLVCLLVILGYSLTSSAADEYVLPLPVEKAEGPVATRPDQSKPDPNRNDESSFGVFGGVGVGGIAGSASNPGSCFILSCTAPYSVSVQGDASGSNLSMAGLRWGWWWNHLGLALEWDYLSFNLDHPDGSVSGSYSNLYVVPMLRSSFFKSPDWPGGRVDLYGGFGFTLLRGMGSATVTSRQPSVSQNLDIGSGDNATGSGSIALLGAGFRLSQVLVFIEGRSTNISMSGRRFLSSDEINVNINGRMAILGVSYVF